MEGFEKNFFGSRSAEIPEPEIKPERKEEKDYYAMLREDLRNMKRGGVDIHFSEIDVDNLSPQALELYRKHKKGILSEKEIKEFDEAAIKGSDDYSFAAMIRNWSIDRFAEEKKKEKELLKKDTEERLNELQKNNPQVAAYLGKIDINELKRPDYQIIADLNKQSFKSYEENLKEYFKIKTSKKELQTTDAKLSLIEKDPRYIYYNLLREALDLGPSKPDLFM